MPRPQLRSRSLKRKPMKLIGTRRTRQMNREKVSAARCGRCGSFLGGVPRLHEHQIRQLAKSMRRPSRIFGGHYCPSCVREMIRDAARKTIK